MVVRFIGGPADKNDADQSELAPVISFSASKRAKTGADHGRARGNHPAGSALEPVDPRDVRDPFATAGADIAALTGATETGNPGSSSARSTVSDLGPDEDVAPRRATLTKLALKREGEALPPEADIEPEDAPPSIEDVENAVLKKLRRRGLSEAEILAECLALDLTAHQANELLERLRGLGYVDDRALAEQLRYSHYERKGQSRQVVARLMSTRKITPEVIDEVLSDIGSDDELALAREVGEKRASQMTGLDDATLERRLVGFLARRGYPGGIVRTVVADILRGRRSSVRFR